MKATLPIAAAVLSAILGALAIPSPGRSGVRGITAPPGSGFHPFAIENSSSKPKTALELASSVEYWVCIAVSASTLRYGTSRGGSESAALSGAQSQCGQDDCNLWACVDLGCVGIDFGSLSVSISYVTGYGVDDGTVAGNYALSYCESFDTGCGDPGWFCSEFVDSPTSPGFGTGSSPTTPIPTTLLPTFTPFTFTPFSFTFTPFPTIPIDTTSSTTSSTLPKTLPKTATPTSTNTFPLFPFGTGTSTSTTAPSQTVFSMAVKRATTGTGVWRAWVVGTVGVVVAVFVF